MKPIIAESLNDIINLDDVRVSPDGALVAFVRLGIDRSANEYTKSVWLLHLRNNSAPEPFTAGRKDSQPRWAEDGSRLGFISERNGDKGIYVIATQGGEGQRVVCHLNGITSYAWSPDGSNIAFTAPVRNDERKREDEAALHPAEEVDMPVQEAWDKQRDKDQREHESAQRFDPRTLREFPYRSGTTYKDDRWSHVYTISVPESFGEGRQTRAIRLTDGDRNFSEPAWIRDGQAIVASLARHPEHTLIERWEDLVKLDSAARSEPLTLVSGSYSHFNPKVSPDGQWLAFQRVLEDYPEFREVTLAITHVGGGEVVDLTAALDRTVDNFEWGRDGAHLYFTLAKDGTVNLYSVAIANRTIEQLTDRVQEITSFDVDGQGRIVFAASTPDDPSALYARELDGSITTLYQPNARFLVAHNVRPVERIAYASDERQIEGWIITPPDFDASRKYPLALEMHGGPSAMWSPSSRSMWHEWQILANAGYVVYFCNPRGSGGYGEAFMRANHGDWGDGPMCDIMRGVDLVIERGFIDTERMVLTGGSYGGYLTAWIVGRTDRFKAAVAQRGVYNLVSFRGVTDIPAFNDRETGATPWDDVQKVWALSPLSLAPNVRTPLLLEHSELDYRVPISQAEELYLALRTFKRTVELIRWPREGHELSRSGEPRHRVERIKRILDWFATYIALDA